MDLEWSVGNNCPISSLQMIKLWSETGKYTEIDIVLIQHEPEDLALRLEGNLGRQIWWKYGIRLGSYKRKIRVQS